MPVEPREQPGGRIEDVEHAMDQGSSSPSEHLSAPRIVGPEDHGSIDGHAVTVWGTADSGVTVELWDWLSLVAKTLTDGDGRWSITLQDVESGEHLYFARAGREPDALSDRSNSIAVRVGSPHTPRQAKPVRTASLRWNIPRARIVDTLRRRQRQSKGGKWTEEAFLEEEWERVFTVQQAPPAAKSPDVTLLDESTVPSPGDIDRDESAPAAMSSQSKTGAEVEMAVAEPPLEVSVLSVPVESEVIEVTPEHLVQPQAPMDLGAANELIETPPVREILTQPVTVTDAPKRVWMEPIAGDGGPIYLRATPVNSLISAHDLGFAPPVNRLMLDGEPPMNESTPASACEEDAGSYLPPPEQPSDVTVEGAQYALVPVRMAAPVPRETALVIHENPRQRDSSQAAPLFVVAAVIAALAGLLLRRFRFDESAQHPTSR